MRFKKNGLANLIPLGLVLAGLLVACPPSPPKPAVVLRPMAGAATGVSVAVGSTIQFVATDETGKVIKVTWDRSPAEGSIDANGNYKAPAAVPANPVVTIKATSIDKPSDFGTLDIRIIEQGTVGISGKVTVNPSLLSANMPEATRTGEARAINSGVVDWNAPHVKGSILLVGSNSNTRAAGLRGVQVRNVSENISSLSVPSGETEQAFAARVSQQTGLIAQPEYIYRPMALPTPNDANYDEQDYLVQIDAQAAWAVQKDLTDNLIAVIDTGIKTDHEDLIGRFTPGKDFCATFNGTICATEDDDPSDLPVNDSNGVPIGNAGHGTSTAGIIAAATNNVKGVSGLAWTGKILVVKVFGYDNKGAASPTSTLAKAIKYAADYGSKVINLSLGIRLAAGATDAGIDDAIDYAVGKGVVIVSAAGNSNEAGFGVYYPARNINVIAVGSVNKTNGISNFSAQGPQLALVAPGEQITSTNFATTTSYGKLSGTSEATPQVAAVAGLMLSKNSALTRVQVREILTSTARNLMGSANTFGAGLLQAGSALRKAANPSAPPAAKTTIYVYADFFDGTKYDPNNAKSGRVVVDLDNSVGNTTYTLTAKRGGFLSLEAGTYRIVACVNKNSNAEACDKGDLGGQKVGVVYNGSTPVTGADVTLAPI